jgi:sulfur-oxidizing protein SoxA
MASHRLPALLLAAMLPCVCPAQQDAQKEVERYRQLLAEGNPADLFEAKGEALWKAKGGPKNASLEQCDLGLGAGVVRGAYARLPRYFPDTDRVQDLESRIVSCMVALQGFKPEEAMKNPFSAPGRPSSLEALASYVAGESKGMKLDAPLSHPREIEAFQIGEQLFYRRAGPHDFGCVSCHGENGKRIRLQELPKLTDPNDARRIFTSWPAYRVSQGTVRTMQHRLYDCYWQMRHPQLDYTSEASIALEVFMAKYAKGGEIQAPGLKR